MIQEKQTSKQKNMWICLIYFCCDDDDDDDDAAAATPVLFSLLVFLSIGVEDLCDTDSVFGLSFTCNIESALLRREPLFPLWRLIGVGGISDSRNKMISSKVGLARGS